MASILSRQPKYEQLCYVFHPVDPTKFPRNPYIFCVHNNHLTDGGNWIGEDWQTKTSDRYKIEHVEVIGRNMRINSDNIRWMLMQLAAESLARDFEGSGC